jgi:hypothetical protein
MYRIPRVSPPLRHSLVFHDEAACFLVVVVVDIARRTLD